MRKETYCNAKSEKPRKSTSNTSRAKKQRLSILRFMATVPHGYVECDSGVKAGFYRRFLAVEIGSHIWLRGSVHTCDSEKQPCRQQSSIIFNDAHQGLNQVVLEISTFPGT
jgi:hypothetical protein